MGIRAKEVRLDGSFVGLGVAVPELKCLVIADKVLEILVELVFAEIRIDALHIGLVVFGGLLGKGIPLLEVKTRVEGEGEYGVIEHMIFHLRLLLSLSSKKSVIIIY